MTRWRLLYRVGWDLAFASHLDRWRAISRSARRAALPLAYSQGFHQRPRLAMGPPLPVGACGEEELADLYLEDDSQQQCDTVHGPMSRAPGQEDPSLRSRACFGPETKDFGLNLCGALNNAASPGLEVRQAWSLPLEERSLTACTYHARWRMDGWWEHTAAGHHVDAGYHAAAGWVVPASEVAQALLAAPSLPLHRITPKGEKDLDLRPYLLALQTGLESIEVELLVTPSGGVRWEEICRLFQERGYRFHLCGLCRTSLKWFSD
ncbi:MAG: DUF2344 domain-containing protein [Coprothermobacterota bacterium]|nr:DUF2344 domain-containing protein [Coprothermobacterota bacterium]